MVFVRIFNHLLRGQNITSRFNEINGKSLTIRITDIPCELYFLFLDGQLLPGHLHTSDVTIKGDLDAFLQLATGQQDPDTLFFRRKLSIEGETETGVHIKNLLDAFDYDWDAHFDMVLFPPAARVAKQFRYIAHCHAPQKLRNLFHTHST
jgi:predicted lipid carrier protein YhbT